jgi:hypothetical protein
MPASPKESGPTPVCTTEYLFVLLQDMRGGVGPGHGDKERFLFLQERRKLCSKIKTSKEEDKQMRQL